MSLSSLQISKNHLHTIELAEDVSSTLLRDGIRNSINIMEIRIYNWNKKEMGALLTRMSFRGTSKAQLDKFHVSNWINRRHKRRYSENIREFLVNSNQSTQYVENNREERRSNIARCSKVRIESQSLRADLCVCVSQVGHRTESLLRSNKRSQAYQTQF